MLPAGAPAAHFRNARRHKREMLISKDVFSPELNDAPLTCAKNATHVLRRRQAGGWVTEVRAIGSVEGFEAELQSAPTLREDEVLVQAEVNANGTRPDQDVAAGVSELTRAVGHEGRGIEVLLNERRTRPPGVQVRIRYKVGAIP